jgi:glycosyltransferase involved in cell wall biosynthesis
MRLAVVGMSHRQVCGVRDHATLLTRELEAAHDVSCSLQWLTRAEGSLIDSRAEVRAWADGLTTAIASQAPDAILFHYSVFAYSYKGIPLFVSPTLSALRGMKLPIVAFLHELAYPWRVPGPRARAWAVSQRLALVPLLRACSGAIVTEDERARWLESSRWLPRRRLVVAPVFSNLPPADAGQRPRHREAPVIGVFGYSAQGAAVSLIIHTVAELRARGADAQLRMLGAPGQPSAAGERWAAAARERGLGDVISFSGALPAQELSNALAACDLLLFSEAVGPTSRKTTLAAALASGTPVVAIEGGSTWPALAREGALRLAQPSAEALAEAVLELLDDEHGAEELGARGRAFAAKEMSVRRTAEATLALLGESLSHSAVPGG